MNSTINLYLEELHACLTETRRVLALVTFLARNHNPYGAAVKDIEDILARSKLALEQKSKLIKDSCEDTLTNGKSTFTLPY